jgi:hypothetical protein
MLPKLSFGMNTKAQLWEPRQYSKDFLNFMTREALAEWVIQNLLKSPSETIYRRFRITRAPPSPKLMILVKVRSVSGNVATEFSKLHYLNHLLGAGSSSAGARNDRKGIVLNFCRCHSKPQLLSS